MRVACHTDIQPFRTLPQHAVQCDTQGQIADATQATGCDTRNMEIAPFREQRKQIVAMWQAFQNEGGTHAGNDTSGNGRFTGIDMDADNDRGYGIQAFLAALLGSTPSCFNFRYR